MSRRHFLQSINRIRVKCPTEFEIITKYLASELLDTDKANRTLTGEQLTRSQGKAQFIEQLLDTYENSVSIQEEEAQFNTDNEE